MHSLSAARSLLSIVLLIWSTSLPLFSDISASAATALATTMGFGSEIMPRRSSRKSCSSTSSAHGASTHAQISTTHTRKQANMRAGAHARNG